MAFKILVVEDEDDVRELVRFTLDRAGYIVWGAAHGEEALDQIEREFPDLVLLDLMMPVMDGFAFARELKRRGLRSRFPVLLMTAYPHAEDVADLLGAVGVIYKPCDLSTLRDQVRRYLGPVEPAHTYSTSLAVEAEAGVPVL